MPANPSTLSHYLVVSVTVCMVHIFAERGDRLGQLLDVLTSRLLVLFLKVLSSSPSPPQCIVAWRVSSGRHKYYAAMLSTQDYVTLELPAEAEHIWCTYMCVSSSRALVSAEKVLLNLCNTSSSALKEITQS